MTKLQWISVLILAGTGFSGVFAGIEVKSIMDEPAVVEPVVRLDETKEQFIERINRENLNSIYGTIRRGPQFPKGTPRNGSD